MSKNMAFNPTYVNLNPYEEALIQQRSRQQSPLDAALQGFNQGIQVQQLPQTLRDQQLQRQLTNILTSQKIYDLQHPDEAAVRDLTKQLTLKGALNPDLGITQASPGTVGQVIANPGAITPEQQASLPSDEALAMRNLASQMGGVNIPTQIPTAPAAGVPETPIVAFGRQTGLTSNPNIPTQAAQGKLDRQIALLNARPETYHTVATDKGLVNVGNRTSDVVPLQINSAPKVGESKVSRFSDAQGNLFQQSSTGGAATPVLDQNGSPINVGIPNKVFFTDQGAMTVPTKSGGTPEVSPLVGENGNILQKAPTPAASLTTEKLAKDIQSNKEIQSYRTVRDALDGLNQTLERAKLNPADQTGIKSSAIDAFNRVINPNSIVRQQAFNQTTSGQSLFNKLENAYNGLFTGQTITPQQIQSMLDTAKKYEESSRGFAEKELNTIKARGDKAGLDPSEYMPDIFPKAQPTSIKINKITKIK